MLKTNGLESRESLASPIDAGEPGPLAARGHADNSSRVGKASEISLPLSSVLTLGSIRQHGPKLLTEANLDRVIRWVQRDEGEATVPMLLGGELLLAGIEDLPSQRDQIRRYIDVRASKGVAALVLRQTASSRKPLEWMVVDGAERGLAIVTVTDGASLDQIADEVQREIEKVQLHLLQHGEQVFRRLSSLMLNGVDVPDLLRDLAMTMGEPVLLVRGSEEIVYAAVPEGSEQDLTATWNELRHSGSDEKLITMSPVPTADGPWGMLVAMGLARPLDPKSRVGIERAAELISLALLRERQEEVISARQRGDFLTALLAGQMTERQAITRAYRIGMQDPDSLLPIVISRAEGGQNGPGEPGWALIARDLQGELNSVGLPTLSGTVPDRAALILAVGVPTSSRREEVAERVASAAQQMVQRHLHPDESAIAFVGPSEKTWQNYREALREVLEASGCVRVADSTGWYDTTLPDTNRLIQSIATLEQARGFADKRLGKLVEYDERRNTELVATLRVLFANDGHKASTARELHLERQSLYSRLARIEEMVGSSLSDEDTRLGLQLALRIRSANERNQDASRRL